MLKDKLFRTGACGTAMGAPHPSRIGCSAISSLSSATRKFGHIHIEGLGSEF